MKRGMEVIFLHFHTYPYTTKASITKVKKLIKILHKFQPHTKLYLIPFARIQEEIVMKTKEKLRIVLYRRFMLRIAEEIGRKENALAIVTGEVVGQVASQTLENIRVIEEVTRIPILRPLVGFDKEEIVQKAKEIHTYDISILPHEDCCTRFIPPHPATKAKIEEVRVVEENLEVESLVNEAVKKAEILEWKD